MSRTRKGTKPPGWELWSKRGFTGWGPGRWGKLFTHRTERREGAEQARREVGTMDGYDPRREP
jgi:hypothetical protein